MIYIFAPVRDQGDEVLNDDAIETGTDTEPEANHQYARYPDYFDGRLRGYVNTQR